MTLRQLLRKPFVTTPFALPADLKDKHIIVTGCGLGSLGYETALQLASWGATVIISTRSNTPAVVDALIAALAQKNTAGKIDGHNLDLSDAASVDTFSHWYKEQYGERLDGLINNAGIHLDLMSKWKEPRLSSDGHELHWRTNYLGTVHLTHNLLPLLQKTGSEYGEARVVNVVSQLHDRGSNERLFSNSKHYNSWRAYGSSKLALIHFTQELDRRSASSDHLKSFSLHPGGKSGAYTNVAGKGLEGHAVIGFVRKLAAPLEQLFLATAQEGAQTQIFCATAAEAKSGHYYVNNQSAKASADSIDHNVAERLWRETEDWLSQITHTAPAL